MKHSISTDVVGQFAAAWTMLGETVQRFPLNLWTLDGDGSLAPARLVYHILETADYYFSPSLNAFNWGGRFGVDWETGAPGNLPTQGQLMAYLGDVRSRCELWFKGVADETMLEPDPAYADEGMSRLDRGLYVLRHTHHHLGTLCAELRRAGLPRPAWR